MSTVLLVVHVFVCLFLMLTVLLQPGKGGGMGAAFGGGGSSSGTVFGGSGASGFLRKMTVASAVFFMLTSMTLAWIASTSGADALQRYSAQQRMAAERKQETHKEAVGTDPEVAPDGETHVIVPDEVDDEDDSLSGDPDDLDDADDRDAPEDDDGTGDDGETP
jgi:preprotein translocase subunit SecG